MISQKSIITFVTLLGIILIVYHKWFFSLEILSYGDWRFLFKETQRELLHTSFLLWRSNGFGGVVLDIGQTIIFFFYGVLAQIFDADYALSERVIHLWMAVLGGAVSIYILLQSIFKSRVAIFTGILFYIFNTYFLIGQTGHLTLMVAFALAPFVLYLYKITLAKQELYLTILTALTFFILGTYEPRAAYVVFGVLFLYFIYFIITQEKKYTKSLLLKTLFYGFMPIIVFGLLNIYWIYALANLGVVGSNALFSRGLYGGNLYTINYAFTLFHPFWTGSALKIFTTQHILHYFWIFPILVILGIIFNRRNKEVLFFAIIALLGVLLSKQSDVPFITIYQWLYDHFPGFNAFREASKFYFLTALGYSVLIASFFSWLWDNWREGKRRKYITYILTGVTIFTLLWNTKPLITGEIGTLFQSRKVPNDFLIVKDFILKQDDYFRTLWIPIDSRWSYYSAQKPLVSMYQLLYTDWNMYTSPDLEDSDTDDILTIINGEEFEYLLDSSSIKYVIVSTRTKENEEDWIGPTNNRLQYINALDEVVHIEKINIGTDEIAVYENVNFKPHLYLTREQESIEKYVPFQKVNHTLINPTKYRVNLDNIKNPIFLNFSEAHHPDWNVRIGEFNWLNAMQDKNYFLSQGQHLRSESGLNAYYLEPEKICKEFNCTKNKDGSYDIEMTLYFKPQSYLYLGMIISGTTLILCLSYLLYYGIKKTTNKK